MFIRLKQQAKLVVNAVCAGMPPAFLLCCEVGASRGIRRYGYAGLQVYQQHVALLLEGWGMGCARDRQAQQGL